MKLIILKKEKKKEANDVVPQMRVDNPKLVNNLTKGRLIGEFKLIKMIIKVDFR